MIDQSKMTRWMYLIQRDDGELLNNVTAKYRSAMSEMLTVIIELNNALLRPAEGMNGCCKGSCNRNNEETEPPPDTQPSTYIDYMDTYD